MEINWVAPFKLAFEMGMFLLGSLLVLVIGLLFAYIAYGLVKGFVINVKKQKESKNQEEKPASKLSGLRSVD